MPSGTRTTDSFAEGLHKLLGSITDLKTTDDADLPFAINLETAVLQRLKQGAQAAMGGTPPGGPSLPGAAAATPGPGMVPGGGPPGMAGPGQMMAGFGGPPGAPPGMPPPGMGGPPGMPPGGLPMGPAGPAVPPAGVPGLMMGPNFPNPEELRRALTTGTTASRLNNVAARLANIIPNTAGI